MNKKFLIRIKGAIACAILKLSLSKDLMPYNALINKKNWASFL